MSGPVAARWALAVTVAVHLAALYWPRTGDPTGISGADKVAHVVIFAMVAVAGRYAGVPRLWLGVLLVAHAVASETVQHLWLPERSGDPWDVLADLVGVAVGLLVPLPRAAARRPGRQPS